MKTCVALAGAAAMALAAPGMAATITYTLSGGFSGAFFRSGSFDSGYSTNGTLTAIGDPDTLAAGSVTLSSLQLATADDSYVWTGAALFSVVNGNQTASFTGAFGVLQFTAPAFATYSGSDALAATPVDPVTFVAVFNTAATTFAIEDGHGMTFAAQRDTPGGGGAGAVPEPASWAMMVGGLGLVGGALRRRTTLRFA